MYINVKTLKRTEFGFPHSEKLILVLKVTYFLIENEANKDPEFTFLLFFYVAVVNDKCTLHGDDDDDDDERCSCICLCVRTVTNSRLTYVTKLAFQTNIKLQYL